jgi:hypothetical protein
MKSTTTLFFIRRDKRRRFFTGRPFLRVIDYLALFILPIVTVGQTTITNSGAVTIPSSAHVLIAGNFVNAATATFVNNGDLTITGNITNGEATMSSGSGTLRLTGAAAQTIAGTQPFVTNNLFLTNTTGYVLLQSLRADGATTFTSGIVTAANAAAPMIFGAAASLAAVSNVSHVNGFVRRMGTGVFAFPVGDAGFYREVDINPSANAGGIDCHYVKADAGSAPFTAGGASATPLVAYNKHEYWDLHPVTTATSTVRIYYDQVVVPGIINSTLDLRVAHQRGGAWLDEGGTPNGSSTNFIGNVNSASVSNWSPFTLGSAGLTSSLPVTLIGFSGILTGGSALLSWQVNNEVNFHSYGVEKSCNGKDYTVLGEVPATNSPSYQYTDAAASCPVAYYRLRLEDLDGNETYSQVVVLNSQAVSGIRVMPNPVEDHMTLSFGTGSGGTYAILLTDMSGRRVITREQTVSDGQSILLNRPAQVPIGNYILTLRNQQSGLTTNFKILIR